MHKLLLTLGLACTFFVASAQSKTEIREAKKWFKERAYLQGLNVKPHQTTDILAFYKQYKANKAVWDKAFAFLKGRDLKTIANGRHEIDGDKAFASVTENPSRNLDSTSWESHRNYIDIQYVIVGEELIGIQSTEGATVSKPYDAAKDVMNYTIDGKQYKATPKSIFFFFPTDAHRPNITPGGNKVVKKVVIKVRVV